ncbi:MULTISPECIES: MarR family transcriptional regulator [Cytobacillus]|uniref:HTH marR-type domain-containing protein n=1 Tax=Cytobacillus kochii TaxID=859143 RepID=A0A248TET8_9BACI|nr:MULTISPECIES: MarR family transcriptional regulator [Cytobacillus]ASV66707.1 hypothetical protein CKF48_04870 [Cytobacillus kochii]MDQ0186451.1 DNA-binding MarR family transcriptional regulator [Cytobacillus kochii]MEA1854134.1 MarR family transcriptional regulator [Cytobacillus sp. OWB-43]MED1607817.1 MarR family transcriptional regulator [Cytobacillus kochii]
MNARNEIIIQHLIGEMASNKYFINVLLHKQETLNDNLIWLMMKLKKRGEMKITDISTDFYMSPAAATNMSDKLKVLGFVTKSRAHNDRRIVSVRLTQEGAAYINALFNTYSYEQLCSLQQQISTINTSLEKIAKII